MSQVNGSNAILSNSKRIFVALQPLLDSFYSGECGVLRRETVDSRGNAGKCLQYLAVVRPEAHNTYDGAKVVVLHYVERPLVATGEQQMAVLAMMWKTQVWSHRVHDLPHLGDAVCVSDDCAAGGTRVQRVTLRAEFGYPSCVEDGPADTVAVAQLLIGRINDGVHMQRCDAGTGDGYTANMCSRRSDARWKIIMNLK